MTTFAKYLVFAVTALSLGFLAWSIGLYSEQMPWESIIKEDLAPRLSGLVEARNRADVRWQLADAQLVKKNAELEEAFLQSPLTNDKVELDVLKRRQVALQTRLKELMAAVMRTN